MGKIKAVCISEKKGTAKTSVGRAMAIQNFGWKATLTQVTGIDKSACCHMKK